MADRRAMAVGYIRQLAAWLACVEAVRLAGAGRLVVQRVEVAFVASSVRQGPHTITPDEIDEPYDQ